MTEDIAERRPISGPDLVSPSDRTAGLPQRPETSVEKSRDIVIKDELLGGVFNPPFSNSPQAAEFLISSVHRLDYEKEIIKPFLRWMVAGRINNPYLVLASTDRPTGREADLLGTRNAEGKLIEDPREVVRIKAREGVNFLKRTRSIHKGEQKAERILQILRQGRVSGPNQFQQRVDDVRLLHELDSVLGFSRMMFQGSHSEGAVEDGTYEWVQNGSEDGKRYREDTARIVDDLVKAEAKNPELPLIDYEVLDEGEGFDRKIRIIRSVRFPPGVKGPRPGVRFNKLDLDLAKEGLSAEERDGYELMALAAHYLSDPLIRTAIEASYKMDDPKVKVRDANERAKSPGSIRVVIERIRNSFLNDFS